MHNSVLSAIPFGWQRLSMMYRMVYNYLQYGTILYDFFLDWSVDYDPSRAL
jgi:hypothetical protein